MKNKQISHGFLSAGISCHIQTTSSWHEWSCYLCKTPVICSKDHSWFLLLSCDHSHLHKAPQTLNMFPTMNLLLLQLCSFSEYFSIHKYMLGSLFFYQLWLNYFQFWNLHCEVFCLCFVVNLTCWWWQISQNSSTNLLISGFVAQLPKSSFPHTEQ